MQSELAVLLGWNAFLMAVVDVFEEMRDLTGFGADVCIVRQAYLLLRPMDTYVPASRGDGSSSLEWAAG